MKIIGRSNDQGFIVDMQRTEMERLLGYYYEPSAVANLKCGDRIEISNMFMQLYNIKLHKKTLEGVAQKLEAYAALLREQDPIIVESIGISTIEE